MHILVSERSQYNSGKCKTMETVKRSGQEETINRWSTKGF